MKKARTIIGLLILTVPELLAAYVGQDWYVKVYLLSYAALGVALVLL